MLNKDEIKGKARQISGLVKEKAGKLLKDPQLEANGEAEQMTGKVQGIVGASRRRTGEAVVKAGKAIADKL